MHINSFILKNFLHNVSHTILNYRREYAYSFHHSVISLNYCIIDSAKTAYHLSYYFTVKKKSMQNVLRILLS